MDLFFYGDFFYFFSMVCIIKGPSFGRRFLVHYFQASKKQKPRTPKTAELSFQHSPFWHPKDETKQRWVWATGATRRGFHWGAKHACYRAKSVGRIRGFLLRFRARWWFPMIFFGFFTPWMFSEMIPRRSWSCFLGGCLRIVPWDTTIKNPPFGGNNFGTFYQPPKKQIQGGDVSNFFCFGSDFLQGKKPLVCQSPRCFFRRLLAEIGGVEFQHLSMEGLDLFAKKTRKHDKFPNVARQEFSRIPWVFFPTSQSHNQDLFVNFFRGSRP